MQVRFLSGALNIRDDIEKESFMDMKDQNKLELIKDKLIHIKDWVLEHSKVIMPLFLIVCVVVTVLIALNANKKDKLNEEAEAARVEAESVNATTPIDVIETPQYELEENAYPEINDIFRTYYDAKAEGDLDTISSMNSYINDIEKIRLSELSKYIDSYPEINVYTKPGLTENSYVAYVCSKVKFSDLETPIPGAQTYYVCNDSEGNYSITDGTFDESIYEYIKNVTVQDDVVALNNKVVAEYNNLLTDNEDINNFVAYLKEKINENVGEMLAEEEAPAATVVDDGNDSASNESDKPTVVNKVKAKERVNIRKSDSKDADKVGSASANEEFKLIQHKDNGWTEIEYNGESAFISSEFVEDVVEVTLETVTETSTTDAGNDTDNDIQTAESAETATANGKVKVKDSGVRIRKEPNTSSEVLGTVYTGERFDFIEEKADWSKIKYNGKIGYIKSEFVEKE